MNVRSPVIDLEQRLAGLGPEQRARLEQRLLQRLQEGAAGEAIPRRSAAGPAPLSFGQERLWFLAQLYPDQTNYIEASACRLTGPLDLAALQAALNRVVERHEILRTTYHEQDGVPVQVVGPPQPVPLAVVDLAESATQGRVGEAQRRFQELMDEPFDLSRDLMLRARLYCLAADDHVLLVVRQNIASDGSSVQLFWSEVLELLAAATAGRPARLPELPVQYADFAAWQRQLLVGERLEKPMAYWHQQLAGLSRLQLPTDRRRPAVPTFRGAGERFVLPPVLVDRLRGLARAEATTLHTVLLAAYAVLLARITGQEDIAIGMPTAGRARVELEPLLGFFVNTLVIRARLAGNPSFRELLRQMHQTVLEAQEHQEAPFEKLVEALQPERALNQSPLIAVAFQLRELSEPRADSLPLQVETVDVVNVHAKLDMECTLVARADGVSGHWRYATDLFQAETIRRLIGHYQTLLAGIANDPDGAIGLLPLLAEAELRQQQVTWNATATSFPDDATIHQLFEQQAAAHPDVVAVQLGDRSLTYAGLNHQANQLAHVLRRCGVGPGTLVGLHTARTPEMVAGILGILKAGGAYVPIDPNYPAQRQAFVLDDAGVQVLLTEEHLLQSPAMARFGARLAGDAGAIVALPAIICLDADREIIARAAGTNPQPAATADDLAYVIYTSGSTGVPKGAMLGHRGLCNLAAWQGKTFTIAPGRSRVLQFAPLSFDASVWEMVMALANGATLVLPGQQALAGGGALVELLRDEGITVATLPPSMLAAMPDADLPALQTIVAAGEACPARLVQRWGKDRQFVNAYGPTEATVCAATYTCDPTDPGNPPIGRPIANVQLFILDANLQPVPVGVPGELCIGGVGLASGYLNRPELTAERFRMVVMDRNGPASETGPVLARRVYRTGDLVRSRPNGNIEFLGRMDRQVKVRGFRIELEEVEAVLAQHPDLESAAVVAWADAQDGRQLAGYVMPRPGAEVAVAGLRAYLRERLPEHMVPALWVRLERIPRTPSGKVDYQALPAPDGTRGALALGREYVAPRDEIENALTAIAAELLAVDRVGIYDSFFELGGHSLLATQFMARVRSALDVALPLRTLFDRPTMAEFARTVETHRASQDGHRQRLEAALARINRLSPEERQALLRAKRDASQPDPRHEK